MDVMYQTEDSLTWKQFPFFLDLMTSEYPTITE